MRPDLEDVWCSRGATATEQWDDPTYKYSWYEDDGTDGGSAHGRLTAGSDTGATTTLSVQRDSST